MKTATITDISLTNVLCTSPCSPLQFFPRKLFIINLLIEVVLAWAFPYVEQNSAVLDYLNTVTAVSQVFVEEKTLLGIKYHNIFIYQTLLQIPTCCGSKEITVCLTMSCAY